MVAPIKCRSAGRINHSPVCRRAELRLLIPDSYMLMKAYAAFAHESVLDPAGTHARTIAGLWSVFLWVTAAVYILVMIALVVALVRKRKGDAAETPRSTYAAVSVAG